MAIPGAEKPGLLDAQRPGARPVRRACATSTAPRSRPPASRNSPRSIRRALPLVQGQHRIGAVRRAAAELRVHRPELRRPRRREQHAGAQGAGGVPQVAQRLLRPERRRDDPARLEQDRLGSGTRRGDRHARALRRRGRRDGSRRRLLRHQRRERARIPARARRHLGQGQGLRHVRPDRPVAGDARRGARSAEPVDVAGRGRPGDAARQHADHGVRRAQAGQLRQPLHHAASRRHHQHRHAARRRARARSRSRSSCAPARPSGSASRGWASRRSAPSPRDGAAVARTAPAQDRGSAQRSRG